MTPSPPSHLPTEPPFTCPLFNRLRAEFADLIPEDRRQEFYRQLEEIRKSNVALREWGNDVSRVATAMITDRDARLDWIHRYSKIVKG